MVSKLVNMLVRIYWCPANLHVCAADCNLKITQNKYMKCIGIFRTSIFVILVTYSLTDLRK